MQLLVVLSVLGLLIVMSIGLLLIGMLRAWREQDERPMGLLRAGGSEHPTADIGTSSSPTEPARGRAASPAPGSGVSAIAMEEARSAGVDQERGRRSGRNGLLDPDQRHHS